jgi:hypothetical protein
MVPNTLSVQYNNVICLGTVLTHKSKPNAVIWKGHVQERSNVSIPVHHLKGWWRLFRPSHCKLQPTTVNRIGGNRSVNCENRSNRSGPVPVGSQPIQIQNLNLN